MTIKYCNMQKIKTFLILFIVSTLNAIAQEYQMKIQKNFVEKDLDSLEIIINDIEKHNSTNRNRYLSYWDAYARYNKSLILSSSGKEKEAEKELNSAKLILEKIEIKTSEDYALLGMCYNFSISFSNFLKIPSLSSKARKIAQEAIKLDPENIRAYLVLGINDLYTPKIYGGQKKCEEHFLKCIAIPEKKSSNDFDPSWGKNDGYYYLISYYLENNEREKAAKYMVEALKIFPEDGRLKSLIKQ